MKKTLPLFVFLFLFWNIHFLKSQCYGYVKYDVSVNANGSSTFNITTTHANDLILIAYDGFSSPGAGPVTVDGNSATHLATANTGNSGSSEVYYYSAAVAGTHTIVCTESGGYFSPYYMNMAAAFYDSATCTPLSGSNVTQVQNAFAGFGTNTVPITTTTPHEMIFNTAEFNTGAAIYGMNAATGAKDLDSIHTGTGLDASIGYTNAPTAGVYTITTSDGLLVGGGGGTAIVVAMIPGTCSSAFTVTNTITQPSCRNNDGKIQLTLSGGTPPFTYSWSPNVSTTATASSLSAGRYIITVTSADGSCSTVIDTVHLVGATLSMTVTDAKCSPVNSGTAKVTVINGKSPFTYLWSNGQSTQTATGLTAGRYIVTITDGVGCVSHDTANIVTYPAPNIVTVPVSDSVCYASRIALTASGGATYRWLPVVGLSCNNCPNPFASPGVTTVYTVTGTDSNGCTNTATVNLKVIPLPRITLSGRDTICIGTGTTISASGATSYLWNPGANTNSSYNVRPATTTTYTLKATADGCPKDTTVKVTVVPIPRPVIKSSKDSVCVGDTLTLSASGGTTYLWTPGNLTNAKIQIHLAHDTTYTLHAYGGTCEDSATVHLKVIQLVTGGISIDHDSICPHGSATITAYGAGGTVSYKWSNGKTSSSISVSDTVTTTYTATIYGTCDSLTEIKTLYVIPLPALTISAPHRFECQGGIDTLTVTSSTNPTTYLWNTGQTGTSIITRPLNGDVIYTVTAKNSLGCSATDTFQVKEAGYPIVSVTYPKACGVGNYVTITADTVGANGTYKYSWSSGSTKDTTVVAIEKSGTVFTLTVSNQYGCSTTTTATVVIDTPKLFACCNTTILLGGDTEILASSPNIDKFQWSPPNSGLSCYTCPSPIASPTVTTTYTVNGVDSADCPIERTVTITVETPCDNFIVPNVFTPTNGGVLGVDNVFYIQTKNMLTWKLTIFDRWGHEVFKSTNPDQYWDGKNESGVNSPEGVYYYTIDASCLTASYTKDGFLQLIR